MKLAYQHLPYYTYEDYKIWKGDWELIGGIPYSLLPPATRVHQFSMIKLARQFDVALESQTSCSILTNLDWIISNDTVVRPNIFVVSEPITTDFLEFPPSLTVEILSKSTAKHDKNLKFKLYEMTGVKYYIIVDTKTKVADIYMLVDGAYKKQASLSDKNFEFDFGGCKADIDFSRIWAK